MQDTDQYRFLIKSAENGLIEVAWSLERDHHPVAVGTVQLQRGSVPEDPLAVQARAYVDEWQRTTGRTL